MVLAARIYVACVITLGLTAVLNAPVQWVESRTVQYVCYLLVCAFASGLKVRLPAIKGTMSVSYVFVLLAIVEFTLFQALLLALLSGIVQTYWKAKSRPKFMRSAFNISSLLVSADIGFKVFHFGNGILLKDYMIVSLGLTACAYFLANTILVAIVVSLTERRTLLSIYKQCYLWYLPYYMMGAWAAGLVQKANTMFGWPVSLLTIPVLVVVYRSYRLYLSHLETQKQHAEEMAHLHLRTIEALALAIEAKDETTHSHLRRVQHYATEVGKIKRLSEEELNALRAAAVLHDIGKLAVPEHIISKPGKLTPEEFEKMKIHPTVGAEILERVQFPYPVAPIVRAHHEKWNGTGYPAGLKGHEIPVGARILAAVDCLDALASDRQYRKALPLDEAMRMVAEESGKSFDPEVISILQQRYVELEKAVNSMPREAQPAGRETRVVHGLAPASGFENSVGKSQGPLPDFLSSIASARQEVQTLLEVSQDLGSSLSLTETISVLDQRLRRLIPFQTLVIFLRQDEELVPEYVAGDNFQAFSSLRIPLGEGLSGWVAANNKPIVNGNPSVEFGYLNDPAMFSTLRSALAMPLVSLDKVQGVIALYHRDADAFSKDHLRILMAISAKITLVVENAMRYRRAEISATIDGLTGLPNASSLFLQLDGELARAKRNAQPLTILVCDLDGFKQINDVLGHLEGNRVLRRVAFALRAACREYDYVARMGGDEFVMVLPGVQPAELQGRIASFSAAVRKIGEECGRLTPLAISVGEASYPHHGQDAEELLSVADHRMYKVKQDRKTYRQLHLSAVEEPEASLNRLAVACSKIQ